MSNEATNIEDTGFNETIRKNTNKPGFFTVDRENGGYTDAKDELKKQKKAVDTQCAIVSAHLSIEQISPFCATIQRSNGKQEAWLVIGKTTYDDAPYRVAMNYYNGFAYPEQPEKGYQWRLVSEEEYNRLNSQLSQSETAALPEQTEVTIASTGFLNRIKRCWAGKH